MQSTFLLFPGAALELGAYFMRLSCFYSLVPNRHEFVQFGHFAHCQRILHIMAIAEQRRVRKKLKFYAMAVASDKNNYTNVFYMAKIKILFEEKAGQCFCCYK
jgi:hypothetical protein